MARGFRDIPDEVISAARDEYHVVLTGVRRLTPIRYRGRVVGFYSPRRCAFGRRIGPLFVMPAFRRRGLALKAYASVRGPLVASIALHERAGFRRWSRYAAGWWWRRP